MYLFESATDFASNNILYFGKSSITDSTEAKMSFVGTLSVSIQYIELSLL